MTAELRRRGMLVKHKRVWRMMREDNLLAVQAERRSSQPRIRIKRWRST